MPRPGAPCPLGLGEHPEATAPPLRASCPLQYEAVMDRVQKSKLSLYKKAMDVSVRVSGVEVWRHGGLMVWTPGPWAGPPGQGQPGTTCPTAHTMASWVLGAARGIKSPYG